MDFSAEQLRDVAIKFIIITGSIALHEWGHAAMADKLGDPTPRRQGRVTLNPLAHIELVGTVIVPLVNLLGLLGSFGLIGWGKPVMIDPSSYRNRKADQAWVTIAGPAINLFIGVAAVIATAIFAKHAPGLAELSWLAVQINAGLIVFNLLPIPPLDGSKFLMYWFGMREELYWNIARFGFLIMLVLINLPQARRFFGFAHELGMIPFKTLYAVLAG